ncbi:MAG TPA: hypothetical protein VKM93_27710 [Terriglobia bacterium]|nr:hypothetical protein [Terriglobia bacterium]
MSWLWQGAILVAVGVLLRRVLHMGASRLKSYNGLTPLNREQARIYDLVVRDLEIEAAILGVALNEAIEERKAGNNEVAWRLVRLAASEWDRLAGAAVTLLSQMSKYLPVARLDSPARCMLPERFKSKSMIDYVRLQEILTQFVLHSKLRFQVHLRVLRRAVETLTAEFRHLHQTAERPEVRALELWGRLDLYFHDLDLLTKETLLALRAFFPGLSEGELSRFRADLHAQLPRFELLQTENRMTPR